MKLGKIDKETGTFFPISLAQLGRRGVRLNVTGIHSERID